MSTASISTSPASTRNDEAQLRAEKSLVRSVLLGSTIGAIICAGIWLGLVTIAVAGKGFSLGPMLAAGTVCGVFAGIFLGGCAGALAGAHRLEEVEHDRMRAIAHQVAGTE